MRISLLNQINTTNSTLKNNETLVVPNVQPSISIPIAKTPNSVLRAYFLNNISFGHRIEEHNRNGAYVDKNGDVFVKLFTFPDVKRVSVIIKDKEAYELQKTENGIFERKLLPNQAKDGDKYCFRIMRGNGTIVECKDPYAMKQEDVLDKYSTIYNHNKFTWSDDEWMQGRDHEKISHRKLKGLKSLNDLKICEVNIATLTKEGNFKAAKKYIDKLADEGIFNAIEIMPVENTHSFNWGYDGVDKFAPQNSVLGGPDALKELIDYAHKKKINVIMDVVPNHMGPDGNFLGQTGPYINTSSFGPFGDKFNLENDPENNKYVRDFISNMCLNWLNNYHCDGLRVDCTSGVESDYTLKQMAMEVHYHNPDAILIAEDSRGNMKKLTMPLTQTEEAVNMSEDFHSEQIEKAVNNNVSLDNLGFDSEWDFNYFHVINNSLYRNENMNNVDWNVKESSTRVKFPMSHDEIGNYDGTRLIVKMAKEKLNLFNKTYGTSDMDRHQKASHAAQNIILAKINGEYDWFTDRERIEFLHKNNIKQDISPEEVDSALNYSFAKNKLAIGHTFVTPGPKMLFQGDEAGSLSYFKFFREFTTEAAKKDMQDLANKGYQPGLSAFMDSKLDLIDYSSDYNDKRSQIRHYVKDLSDLLENNPALKDGYVEDTVIHDISQLHSVHLKRDQNEIFTITNFKDSGYPGNYGLLFPKGQWKEVLNSNDPKYGGNGYDMNRNEIRSNGYSNSDISIPANSLLVFKRVG